MDRFAVITGRQYQLFDYSGHPQAERVIVIMGSGGETAQQTAEWLNERGEKTGVLRVRLYRPFFRRSLYQRAAFHHAPHRRARPHQGTGRHRRTALRRYRGRFARSLRQRAGVL
jgi:hypothetical protein